jgi:peroxiredoxin
MFVDDGVVKVLDVEDSPGVCDVSDASHLLEQL